VNIQLLLAAGFAGIAALLHGGLAEAYAFLRHATTTRLPATTLPHQLRFLFLDSEPDDSRLQWAYLRAGWHFVTADAATTCVLLALTAAGAVADAKTIAAVTAVRWAVYGGVWFGVVAARHKSVLRAPQWILPLTIAGFASWGAATS
jgi:hypothetical protein